MKVAMVVNGAKVADDVPERCTLADFLRTKLDLTGTHLGCEQGACGACTVLLDGEPVRSCLTFAVQVEGATVTTVEGLSGLSAGSSLHPLQDSFLRHRALQCGFCTPGFLMVLTGLLRDGRAITRVELLEALSGNLCRCTGYQPIVDASSEVLAEHGLLLEEDG